MKIVETRDVGTHDGKITGTVSLDAALDILDFFLSRGTEAPLSELASCCHMSKAAAQHALRTLEARRFIEWSPETRRYSLGVRVFELGAMFHNQLDIRRAAIPEMTSLVEQTGQAVFLCITDGDEAICLERVEGRHRARIYALRLGERQPLHCGAAPRALMTDMSDAELIGYASRTGLPGFTPHTITNLAALIDNVHEIRETGYSVSIEDVSPGVAAIGAPVRDHLGRILASISVSGIATAYSKDRIASLVDAVQSAAYRISQKIGYNPELRSGTATSKNRRKVRAIR
jgi:DNA-binding IclR family transcriptional regulator